MSSRLQLIFIDIGQAPCEGKCDQRQVCTSVHSAVRARQTDTHTYTHTQNDDAKTITPVADARCNDVKTITPDTSQTWGVIIIAKIQDREEIFQYVSPGDCWSSSHWTSAYL